MELAIAARMPPLRVLVADDSRDAADTLAALVQYWGHETHVSYDGDQALEAAETFLPEVMLLDIGMPALDGFQVAETVRAHAKLRTATLIAVTAYSDAASRQRVISAGFDLHLIKPVEPMLLDRILKVVRIDRRDPRRAGMRNSALKLELAKLVASSNSNTESF